MKLNKWAFLLVIPIYISTTTPPGQQVYWAVFGPLDVSTAAPMDVSTPTAPAPQDIQIKADTGDCYKLTVTPNGTLGTEWEACK